MAVQDPQQTSQQGATAHAAGGVAATDAAIEAAHRAEPFTSHSAMSRTRLAILRNLAKAVWACVDIAHVATYKTHCLPCLALCFVPGIPGTLVWVEESARAHVCTVLHPEAHQVVHLRTLPMQMALGRGGAYARPQPLSSDDNWGFGTDCVSEDAIEFQVRFGAEFCTVRGCVEQDGP